MIIKELRRLDFDKQMIRRIEFMTATDVKSACDIAWSAHTPEERKHEFYFHYTTLPYLMSNILNGKWYLKRSTSQRFNDLQETKKFGRLDKANHTYQLSFGRGVRESAALWELYGKDNPFAIKVLIPALEMDAWVELLGKQYCEVGFKDVIYASIPLEQKLKYQKARGMNLIWDGVTCNFAKNKTVKEALSKELRKEEYTGWIKDLEWMHETETRLCVHCPEESGESIAVAYPPELVERMSFTFSPWADNNLMEAIKETLVRCLKKNQQRLTTKKRKGYACRFHCSTVAGALNFMDEMPVKCQKDHCRFGMLLDEMKDIAKVCSLGVESGK